MRKLLVSVILMFAGSMLTLACVLIIFAQKRVGSALLWVLASLGLMLTLYSLARIIEINREWKRSNLPDFSVVASWTVEGNEWDQYKRMYLSDVSIKKDSLSYAAIAALLASPFIFIILLTQYQTAFSATFAGFLALALFALIFALVYTINRKRKIPQRKSNQATVECGTEVVLFNGHPIFLSTPQLGLVQLRNESEKGVNSLVFVLEFRMGYRRITQEHRIPFPLSSQNVAMEYLDLLKNRYSLK